MEALKSFSSYSSITKGNETTLKQKVKEYKRLYFFIKLTGFALLTCVITYILLFLLLGKVYYPLNGKQKLGNNIAADSSGNIIAAALYNTDDTTVAIIISSDSGHHFEQLGGPWKMNDDIGLTRINLISIAPDNKSIVAVGNKCVYLKAAQADSFTCLNTTKLFNGYNGFNVSNGLCFVPGTDSVYIYNSIGDIFCFDYKRYDSFAFGHFKDVTSIISLSVNAKKEIVVIGFGYLGEGAYKNNQFENLKTYAAVNYINDGSLRAYIDSLRNPFADTASKMMADSTSVPYSDTSSLMTDTSGLYNASTKTHKDSMK